ncbi:DUF4148 domain-containing protein [Burkholderia sp. L27(2015)]|jgi:hypothetical protein|uniref:DUF4148 domain-containing protein n=1 Tax=Burkholderia sp. L27(2015) TaxID=1641858 RepID=UPI00131D8293|nr:DUF4148 domain-containing protein [Burkholderia sp. L27(2015)]
MTRNHLIAIRAIPVAMLSTLLICPPTYAQTGSGTTSTTTRAEQKQELKTLEQNGYHPGGDDTQYPTDIQRAEKKAQGQPVSRNPNLP